VIRVLGRALVLWGVFFCMLCVCSCSLLQAITEEQKPIPDNQKAQLASVSGTNYFSHIIRWPGENLSRISMWYTGTVNNWQRIQEANSLIDPKQIDIGDTILIPEILLITREPMPMEFRGNVQKKKKPVPEALPEPSSNSGEIRLFGPIEIETEEVNNNTPGGLSLPLETIE